MRRFAVALLALLLAAPAFAQDVINPQTDASKLTTGALPAGRLPALTGDVTSSAGSAATTLAAGSASNLNSGTLNNARLPARSSLAGAPANQSTAVGTQTMVGAGGTCTITPATSTRLLVIFSGILNNGTASQSVTMQLRFGTGAAPANGAAVTGTTVGGAVVVTNLVAASNQQFVLQGIITGLTATTAYWIDFSGSAPTGTTSWSSMVCSAMEF